ncbi:MAG TPA: hypothetical protein VNA25_05415 [Phycisphaerae bacterium]|nr:hypothetical protein [Phycisphaerae bacterium]
MRQKHDISAVVVGMNVNGLAVTRVLGRHGVPVAAIAQDTPSAEVRTRYVRELWHSAHGGDILAELLLEQGRQSAERPVLFPITDEAVQTVADHLDELGERYRIGMSEAVLVRSLLDKRGFGEIAQRLSMPAPRTFFVDRAEQMEEVAQKMAYPCILKPQVKSTAYQNAGGKKAYLLDNTAALLNVYGAFRQAEPRVIVQEYIPGGDNEVYFCLQYYNRSGEPLVSFCGHKIRQWPPLCGGTASCEPVDVPELVTLSSGFFQQLRFHGLCSMEFKRDPRDGRFLMIEPTVCRTDWQSGVADINGVPIPYIAYCDLTGAPLPNCVRRQRPIKWVHLSSDRQSADYYRKRGELTRWQWLTSIRPPVRGALFAWDDPKPWLSLMWLKVVRKIRRLFDTIHGHAVTREKG